MAKENPVTKFVKLLEDRLLVIPDEPITQTVGGILLPDTAQQKPRKGKVLMVGPGKVAELTGARISMNTNVGDRVLFTFHSGADVEVEGYKDKLRLMHEREILAVIE